LSDFTNLASVFGRFTITKGTFITLPYAGFTEALPSFRAPMAIGYFND
jgi:hypothetical protein